MLAASLLLAACGGSDTVRYRLTVDVATPDGVRSGSSVMSFSITPGFPQAFSPDFRGEAVAVDLGRRGVLFMILDDSIAMLPENVFRRTGLVSPEFIESSRNDRVKALDFLADQEGATATLECVRRRSGFGTECPRFVRFRDLADPTSVEKVDPDNLAASFGPGYALRRITITITDDPATHGIEKRLGWLSSHKGSLHYTGRLHPDQPEKDLTSSAFLED